VYLLDVISFRSIQKVPLHTNFDIPDFVFCKKFSTKGIMTPNATYVSEHCTNARNCHRRQECQLVCTAGMELVINRVDEISTHHRMYPSGRNDHGVALCKLNFTNIVNQIAQPCVVLDFCSRPPLVCCQICRRGTYKVEYLTKYRLLLRSSDKCAACFYLFAP
jgi:hypothetical protein